MSRSIPARGGPSGYAVRTLDDDAPWAWLGAALKVYLANPIVCVGYGATFVGLGAGLFVLLSHFQMAAVFPVMIGAFALLGPLMACGLYSVARAARRREAAGLNTALLPRAVAPTQLAYLAVIVMIAGLMWMIAALIIYGVAGGPTSLMISDYFAFVLTPRGMTMIALGTAVGGAIAVVIFVISAFSFPMLMDEDKDFVTAIGFSVSAVRANPKAMLLWAWIIVLALAISVMTFSLALVFFFPLIGIATYLGYCDVRPAASISR